MQKSRKNKFIFKTPVVIFHLIIYNRDIENKKKILKEEIIMSERKVYKLDDGTAVSRSKFIRQEFSKDKSRKQICEENDFPYHSVYAATANLYNAVHTEDGSALRGVTMVRKVNTNLEFIDTEEQVVEEELAPMIPRTQLMKELVEAGLDRSSVAEYLGVSKGAVYAATKGLGETRGRKTVIHPDTGTEMSRNDYIRELFVEGVSRKDIAAHLTQLTGEYTDYGTVWAACKSYLKANEEELDDGEDEAQEVQTEDTQETQE